MLVLSGSHYLPKDQQLNRLCKTVKLLLEKCILIDESWNIKKDMQKTLKNKLTVSKIELRYKIKLNESWFQYIHLLLKALYENKHYLTTKSNKLRIWDQITVSTMRFMCGYWVKYWFFRV